MEDIFVVIRDMSAGNDSVGEMWQETKIFSGDTTISEVMAWAVGEAGDYFSKHGYPSKKRITITRPDTTTGDQPMSIEEIYRYFNQTQSPAPDTTS